MAEHIPSVVIWGDGGGSTFRATVDAVHNGTVNFDVVGVITTDPVAGILQHAKVANIQYSMDIEPLVVEGRPGRRQDEATQESILEFLDRRGARSLMLMGAMVIMGSLLVQELNGEVPEEPLPKTLEEARTLMVPSDDGFAAYLPPDFPKLAQDTGIYGLANTHPAPTIVTANTHGVGSQKRMILLHAAESAHTFHVVAHGVDTGPIIAAHRFPVTPLHPDASPEEIQAAAEALNQRVQRIEKAHLPLDVEMQLLRREQFLASR